MDACLAFTTTFNAFFITARPFVVFLLCKLLYIAAHDEQQNFLAVWIVFPAHIANIS